MDCYKRAWWSLLFVSTHIDMRVLSTTLNFQIKIVVSIDLHYCFAHVTPEQLIVCVLCFILNRVICHHSYLWSPAFSPASHSILVTSFSLNVPRGTTAFLSLTVTVSNSSVTGGLNFP